MAKEIIKIGLQIEYDAEAEGVPARIFLYRLINDINNEHPVKSIRYKGVEKSFLKEQGSRVRDLELRDGRDVTGQPFVES